MKFLQLTSKDHGLIVIPVDDVQAIRPSQLEDFPTEVITRNQRRILVTDSVSALAERLEAV